jgi:hypothetical protein
VTDDRGGVAGWFRTARRRAASGVQLLAEHEAALDRIMANPEQAASYRSELSAWDGTLLDGLKDLSPLDSAACRSVL